METDKELLIVVGIVAAIIIFGFYAWSDALDFIPIQIATLTL